MAIPLELQIRQLAHVATGDKLVCPRNGELQQGSSGAVWNRQVPASEDSTSASSVSCAALIVSLAFGLLPADLIGSVAARQHQLSSRLWRRVLQGWDHAQEQEEVHRRRGEAAQEGSSQGACCQSNRDHDFDR